MRFSSSVASPLKASTPAVLSNNNSLALLERCSSVDCAKTPRKLSAVSSASLTTVAMASASGSMHPGSSNSARVLRNPARTSSNLERSRLCSVRNLCFSASSRYGFDVEILQCTGCLLIQAIQPVDPVEHEVQSADAVSEVVLHKEFVLRLLLLGALFRAIGRFLIAAVGYVVFFPPRPHEVPDRLELVRLEIKTGDAGD